MSVEQKNTANSARKNTPKGSPKKTQGKGKGSRSGVNRRNQGNSDDEVAKLNGKNVEEMAAGKKGEWLEEDKMRLVKYICDFENDGARFVDFKLTKAHEFQNVDCRFHA